jgi:hypothetical protein
MIFNVATLIFSNPGPSTNLLIHVTKVGSLDHRSSNPLVTDTCRLRSVLTVCWLVSWWLVLTYVRTPPTHCYLESSGQTTYVETYL